MSSSSTTAPPPAIGWNVQDSDRSRVTSGSVVMMSLACEFSISDRIILPLAAEIDPAPTQAAMMSDALGAALHEIVGQIHHLAEAMIHHREPAVGAEHAQAVRHVVQRGVELAGQRRLALARDQRLDENRLQAGRDVLQRRRRTARSAPPCRCSRDCHAAPAPPTVGPQASSDLHMEYPRPAVGPAAPAAT